MSPLYSILLFFFTGDFITYFKDLIAPSEVKVWIIGCHFSPSTCRSPLNLLHFPFTLDIHTFWPQAAESPRRGSGTMDEPLLDPVPNKISFGRISHRLQASVD